MTKSDEKKVQAMARRFSSERDELWDKLLEELQCQTPRSDDEEIEEMFGALT